MPRRGKKYREAVATLDPTSRVEPGEAIDRVKELAFAGFDETVELAIRLGVDPRKADQIVRGTVILPAGTGKDLRVLVLAQGDPAREAEEAGADFVGTEYVEKIEGGWVDFDVAIATPDLMKDVGKLGRILGPRGLMPTPKAGTVTMEVGRAVRESKAGKIEFRVDRTGNVHVPIGKVSFESKALLENFEAIIEAIIRSKPSGAKGTYVRSVSVSSSMGPGIAIDPNLFRRVR
jgi:large subunit ribosomal protein L1